jgi:hypothetical protein
MKQSVILTFRGALSAPSFADFARHRAARLSLGLDLMAQSDGQSEMRVSGPPALVDAFEMALSLGPLDCLVTDVERRLA